MDGQLDEMVVFDRVLSTNEMHSVREFIEECAKCLGIDLVWKGKGVKEIGYNKKNGKTFIKIDPKYYRPAEVDLLLGDPSMAKNKLNWKPRTSFKQLVKIMLKADLKNEGLKIKDFNF